MGQAYDSPHPYDWAGSYDGGVSALPPAVRYTYATVSAGWALQPRRRSEVASAWQLVLPQRSERHPLSGFALARRIDVSSGWIRVPAQRADRQPRWGQPPPRSAEVQTQWIHIPAQRADRQSLWAMPPARPHEQRSMWDCPPARRVSIRLPFDLVQARQRELHALWAFPPNRQIRHVWPWGFAPPVRWSGTSPGVIAPPLPPVNPPYYIPPPGDRVDLPLECLWFDEDGGELALPIGPYACYASTLYRRSYIVQNSVTVVRLPERTPISVASGSIQRSADNPFIAFSITLSDPADVSYLLADGDGNKLVEIAVNGRVYVMLVESRPDQSWQTFPGTAITLTGRSQTCVLDAPIAPLSSYVQPTDMSAQQIMTALLEFTGFSVDYRTVDWVIPAGTFHYANSTVMAAIQTIAAAAGAVVQSHPSDKVLIIRPRYPVKPWDWTSTTPDKVIPWAILEQPHATPETPETPVYNNVLVSGEQIGVSDPIIRNGTAGDIRAPQQIIDPLIITHPVALERGGQALSNTGKKDKVTATTRLAAIDDTSMPGEINPLDLCSVVAETSYMAQCSTSSITFGSTQSGNGAFVLTVDQAIELERQLTNAN